MAGLLARVENVCPAPVRRVTKQPGRHRVGDQRQRVGGVDPDVFLAVPLHHLVRAGLVVLAHYSDLHALVLHVLRHAAAGPAPPPRRRDFPAELEATKKSQIAWREFIGMVDSGGSGRVAGAVRDTKAAQLLRRAERS